MPSPRGKELRRFKLTEELAKKVTLKDLRLSDDGTRLITGHDTTALVWDVAAATGKK